jgi:hypothetical protein
MLLSKLKSNLNNNNNNHHHHQKRLIKLKGQNKLYNISRKIMIKYNKNQPLTNKMKITIKLISVNMKSNSKIKKKNLNRKLILINIKKVIKITSPLNIKTKIDKKKKKRKKKNTKKKIAISKEIKRKKGKKKSIVKINMKINKVALSQINMIINIKILMIEIPNLQNITLDNMRDTVEEILNIIIIKLAKKFIKKVVIQGKGLKVHNSLHLNKIIFKDRNRDQNHQKKIIKISLIIIIII